MMQLFGEQSGLCLAQIHVQNQVHVHIKVYMLTCKDIVNIIQYLEHKFSVNSM